VQLPARLKPVMWPHFMDKKENDKRVYYKSSSVLGQIYDLADISTDNLSYSHQGTSAAPCVIQSFCGQLPAVRTLLFISSVVHDRPIGQCLFCAECFHCLYVTGFEVLCDQV
jgi:hypothetical protein